MNRKTVWLLLTEGFNVAEIAAAAGVGMAVAHAMVAEVIRARTGEPLTLDTNPVLPVYCATDGLKLMAAATPTPAETLGIGQ